MTSNDVINLTQIEEQQDVAWDKAAARALFNFWLLPIMTERDTLESKIARKSVPFKISDIFHCEALGVTDSLYMHGGRTRIFDAHGNNKTVTEPKDFIQKKLSL